MLFSSSEVSDYVNSAFEPAWESVRPAPMVTIDFGNGHVVKRTLQGNIATYVCAADGTVLDVLPGIYTPDVYRKQLEALKTLADSLRHTSPREEATATEQMRANWTLASRLREYHILSEAKLSAPAFTRLTVPGVANFGGFSGTFSGSIDGNFSGGFGINHPGFGGGSGAFGGQPRPITSQMEAVGRIGGAFKGASFPPGGFGGFSAIGIGGSPGGFGGPGVGFSAPGTLGSIAGTPFSGIEGPLIGVLVGVPTPRGIPAGSFGKLADRPELKLDTEVNERIRRKAVHAYLARQGPVQPNDIKKWLFREVLHADLDDPKLGLSAVLDANYPFADEDRARGGKP